MKIPSEYLASAYAKLTNGALRGCSAVMRWGEVSATVTCIGSPSRGEDTVTDSEIPERRRVLAPVVPFCKLSKGCAVELDGALHVVTSCVDNITRSAFFTVGLSDAFSECPAGYSCVRRLGNGVRAVDLPIGVLYLETGRSENLSSAVASASEVGYLVAFRGEDWRENSEPQVGDSVKIAPNGQVQNLKVTFVARHDGWYLLQCRTRGGS
ncbi:MAG: hypothetical protein K6G94_09690 [Kiritimatiellae bacterium]|nr:hypothetical protein [Kiritimatiellia bacterium]